MILLDAASRVRSSGLAKQLTRPTIPLGLPSPGSVPAPGAAAFLKHHSSILKRYLRLRVNHLHRTCLKFSLLRPRTKKKGNSFSAGSSSSRETTLHHSV